MALDLIAVFIDTPKVVAAPVDVKHNTISRVGALLAFIVVGFHFDPLGLERALWLAPLPPLLAANLTDPVRPELLSQEVCRAQQVRLRDLDMVDPDPLRVWDPLAGEGLQFLDGVARGMGKKGADQVQPLVIGEMRCGLVGQGLSVQVLFCVSPASELTTVMTLYESCDLHATRMWIQQLA